MTLSMALWKAVADRHQLLLAVWDGGRVLEADRERLATLIHGRLDATLDPAVLAKSASDQRAPGTPPPRWRSRCPRPVGCPTRSPASCGSGSPSTRPPTRTPRASRISAPRWSGSATRSASSPTTAAPGAQHTWDELAAPDPGRHRARPARRRRGRPARPPGERRGPVRARPDRRRRASAGRTATRRSPRPSCGPTCWPGRRPSPSSRQRCVEAVDPAPHYAVPDVEALGPVPTAPAELAAYRARLGRVGDAMNLAHASYAAALGRARRPGRPGRRPAPRGHRPWPRRGARPRRGREVRP